MDEHHLKSALADYLPESEPPLRHNPYAVLALARARRHRRRTLFSGVAAGATALVTAGVLVVPGMVDRAQENESPPVASATSTPADTATRLDQAVRALVPGGADLVSAEGFTQTKEGESVSWNARYQYAEGAPYPQLAVTLLRGEGETGAHPFDPCIGVEPPFPPGCGIHILGLTDVRILSEAKAVLALEGEAGVIGMQAYDYRSGLLVVVSVTVGHAGDPEDLPLTSEQLKAIVSDPSLTF